MRTIFHNVHGASIKILRMRLKQKCQTGGGGLSICPLLPSTLVWVQGGPDLRFWAQNDTAQGLNAVHVYRQWLKAMDDG